MGKTLISFDTDSIKEYVFATGTLKEIRGASTLFDELNRIEMKKIVNDLEATIYANGGSGMFVVDSNEAEKIIQNVQRMYREDTITGSITGVTEELPENWKMDDDVHEQIQRLSYKLRLAKGKNQTTKTVISHPLFKECESCGIEYATEIYENALLCSSCQKKREKNRDVKNDLKWLAQDHSLINVTSPKLWHRILNSLKVSSLVEHEFVLPDDFNELGKLSQPQRYMGLIYADGNDMGRFLENLKTLEEVKKFSRVVDDAIYEAVQEAIRKHLLPKSGQCVLPFDILLLGGDDLVMVTTAQNAIETAVTIAQKFYEYTREHLSEPLTLSVGVAIAHVKYPFGSFLNLAEDLLKFAKKENVKRQRQNPANAANQGIINFQVINSSNSLNFTQDYRKVYVHEEGAIRKLKLLRTLRPYYVSQSPDVWSIDKLLEKIRKLKKEGFPKNKLQALYDTAFLTYNDSVLQGLAIQNRLKKAQRTCLEDIMQVYSAQHVFDMEILPWFGENDRYYTPFVDIAELYDFIQGGAV